MTIAEIARSVPPAIVAAVDAYAESRLSPTMFVRALLANDLTDALAYRPKEMTLDELCASVKYIFNRVPGRSRGSASAVNAWLSRDTKAPAWGAHP